MTQLASSTCRVLGTTQRVVVTEPEQLEIATRAVDRLVARLDETCSRFRDDSELAGVQAAAGREVEVSPLLGTALAAALRAARITVGAVDPTVGSAVRRAGYSVDFASVARDGEAIVLPLGRVPGWQRIQFDERRRTVRVPVDVELDLGSTAKALGSDLAAAAARRAMSRGGVLVSLGGDIAVAGAPPADGWHIQVAEDHETPVTADGETIAVTRGGVATSSTTVRRWTRGGFVLHHIIDPATGIPAAGPWRTVTVVAGSCVDANIATTAGIVLGIQATDWMAATGLPARLVDHGGRVVRIGGWPADAPAVEPR
jgi:thiamine biosynthesis lipoprotein